MSLIERDRCVFAGVIRIGAMMLVAASFVPAYMLKAGLVLWVILTVPDGP
jgi:hypothetical protein